MSLTQILCIVALLLLPAWVYFFRVFIRTPIRIHRRQAVTLKPSDRPAEPGDMTPETINFIRETLRQFNEIGFEVVRNRFITGNIENVGANNLLLVNRTTRDVASIVAVRGADSRNLVFAIESEFANGLRVATAFNSKIRFLPRQAGLDSLVVHGVKALEQSSSFTNDAFQIPTTRHCPRFSRMILAKILTTRDRPSGHMRISSVPAITNAIDLVQNCASL